MEDNRCRRVEMDHRDLTNASSLGFGIGAWPGLLSSSSDTAKPRLHDRETLKHVHDEPTKQTASPTLPRAFPDGHVALGRVIPSNQGVPCSIWQCEDLPSPLTWSPGRLCPSQAHGRDARVEGFLCAALRARTAAQDLFRYLGVAPLQPFISQQPLGRSAPDFAHMQPTCSCLTLAALFPWTNISRIHHLKGTP